MFRWVINPFHICIYLSVIGNKIIFFIDLYYLNVKNIIVIFIVKCTDIIGVIIICVFIFNLKYKNTLN